MRIVSKKKDYYDCIQAHDQDRSIVYVRDEKEVFLKNKYPFSWGWQNIEHNDWQIRTQMVLVGFCGKVYAGLELLHWYNRLGSYYPGPNGEEPDKVFCYTLEAVDHFFEKHLKKDEHHDYLHGREMPSSRRGRQQMAWRNPWGHQFKRENFGKFFEHHEKVRDGYRKYFDAERSPIFRVNVDTRWNDPGGTKLTYNAMLNQIEFYRLFDANRAYQEIMMFMNNMAMPERPIPQLSNEDLAHSKGHGGKYSFRKAPTKHR
jgi:hypothetical protein